MATLFGELQSAAPSGRPYVSDRLPTEHELPPAQRIQLEGMRVNALLARLGALLSASPDPKPGVPCVPVPLPADPPAAKARTLKQADLTQVNLLIVEWLACAGRELGIAYQLGRSLRDTANPPLRPENTRSAAETQEISNRKNQLAPNDAVAYAQKDPEYEPNFEFDARDALVSQISVWRGTTMQDWLFLLAPNLPPDSASIVSVSIGWSATSLRLSLILMLRDGCACSGASQSWKSRAKWPGACYPRGTYGLICFPAADHRTDF